MSAAFYLEAYAESGWGQMAEDILHMLVENHCWGCRQQNSCWWRPGASIHHTGSPIRTFANPGMDRQQAKTFSVKLLQKQSVERQFSTGLSNFWASYRGTDNFRRTKSLFKDVCTANSLGRWKDGDGVSLWGRG